MEFQTLNNGIKIPVLGFGVWQIFDQKECQKAVEDALSVGYRLIDTASLYRNEKAVGRAIKTSGIPREDIFLTSKAWISQLGYEDTKLALKETLRKLDTDYLDLYLIHQPFGAQVILRWQTQQGILTIPKSTHIERMKENFDSFDFHLDQADLDAISKLDRYPDAYGPDESVERIKHLLKYSV